MDNRSKIEEIIKRGEGDHRYNKEQSLCRLSIQITNENITELVENLKMLSIVPRAIFKTERGLTIEWWALNTQIIRDKYNYIKLIEEFLEYVEGIGFNEWTFDIGYLGDDVPTIFEDSMGVVNPRFTVKKFSNKGEIEIFN